MTDYEIIKLKAEDYHKCSAIWDMEKHPDRAKYFYNDLLSGNRLIYIYTENGEYLGEGSLVIERNDPDYSIPGIRIYFSRLIVRKGHRNRGIGGILIDYIVKMAKEMGYREISVGVDKANETALHLYRGKGFDEVIFEGEDNHGPYYKLLKRI